MPNKDYFIVDHLSTAELSRIFGKIEINAETQCWLWMGNKPSGYGHVKLRGETVKVHRLMYAWLVGPLPRGLKIRQVDHLCKIKHCCNPVHLEKVTPRINTLRSNAIQAVNFRKTECGRGHSLSGGSLRIDPRGYRQCRTCDKIRRGQQYGDAQRIYAREWWRRKTGYYEKRAAS